MPASFSNPTSISFIVASYNDAAKIECTIQSILDIADPLDHILIVDGASSDATVDFARAKLQGHENVLIVSEPDTGIYDAWNKVLGKIKTDWVCFLGCGDILRSDYRAAMMAALAKNPATNFIHTTAQFYLNDAKSGKTVKLRKFGRALDKSEFKKRMRICHVAALHHKSLFEKHLFSTDYKCVSDYYFLLIELERLKPCFVEKVLVEMEASGVSMNSLYPIKEEMLMKLKLGQYSYLTLLGRRIWTSIKYVLFKLYNAAILLTERLT